MGDRMMLELGAQTRAAQLVADAVPEVVDVLEGLGRQIDAAAGGFRGASAAGLAEALGEWFTAVKALPAVMSSYAAALAAVDRAAALADSTGSGALAAGGSGLNMGPR